MAIERSGFFNSKIVDGVRDRKYDATDYAEYFSTFISDGVFINPVNQLQVVSNGGMNIVIKSGKAFIEGYWYYLDEDKEIELPVNTTGKEMNIKIVVSLNRADRAITSSYEVGSTFPVNDGTKHELVIATIVVPASVTSITDANITDRRKEEQYCGFVTTLVKGVDIEPLFLQMDAQFQEWFESIRGQLSEDAAGNLQLQIGNLEELSTETKESLVLAINEVYEEAKKSSRDMIGDEYNPKNSYATGEYCIHGNKMQKCKTATAGTAEVPEEFDQAKWEVVTIAGELCEQNANIKWKKIGTVKGVNQISIANVFDNANEFLCEVSFMGSPSMETSIISIIRKDSGIKLAMNGYFYSSAYNASICIGYSKTGKYIYLNKNWSAITGGGSIDDAVLTVLYR